MLAEAAGFFGAGFFAVVAAAPDETRDECFGRCLMVVFFGGVVASAIDDSANVAMSATRTIFSVLRTIPTSSKWRLP